MSWPRNPLISIAVASLGLADLLAVGVLGPRRLDRTAGTRARVVPDLDFTDRATSATMTP
jgi:hypothetical protein